MKINVTLSSHEAQNLLAMHLQEKFKHFAARGEYICATRVGEPPAEVTFTVEVKQEPWDDR